MDPCHVPLYKKIKILVVLKQQSHLFLSGFVLLPLLSEVAAQLNRIMNLVLTQAKNPESSFRDNKEYNCTDNQVRYVGV